MVHEKSNRECKTQRKESNKKTFKEKQKKSNKCVKEVETEKRSGRSFFSLTGQLSDSAEEKLIRPTSECVLVHTQALEP